MVIYYLSKKKDTLSKMVNFYIFYNLEISLYDFSDLGSS